MIMEVSPFDALVHQIETRPEATAFVYKGAAWTYERLGAEVRHLACGLSLNGVRAGNRVAFHLHNGPQMIATYYACFQLDAIVSPLRAASKVEELTALLIRLKPVVYIGDARLQENINRVEEAVLPLDRRFTVNGMGLGGSRSWDDLLDQAGDPPRTKRRGYDVPAVLINTSGTTAHPRLVSHTRRTLSSSVALIINNWNLSSGDMMLMYMSMVHISGLMSVLSCIQLGLPFVLLETFDADDVLDSIERYRCTWSVGYPAQYSALLERQRARARDLSSLRICITGADVCPLNLQREVSDLFCVPLYNLWWATEVIGSLTYGPKLGPVARVAKGVQVRLVDDNGNDVGRGQAGELLVRGMNVFSEYWNDPDATREAIRGGWYHTGDIMRRGDGDDLWYVSRTKDIIMVGGVIVSPLEVESVLLESHWAVAEAAVVGIPDAAFGELVFGFVKLVKEASGPVCVEILRRTSRKLAAYKVPVRLRVLQEMPRNALSKIDRNVLKAMAAGTAN